MALTPKKVYAILKKYTDDSIAGGGISAGKNCIITDISEITGGNRVTFQWTLDNGTVKTDTMDVMNGLDGQDGEPGQDGAPGQDGLTPAITITEITGGHRVTVEIGSSTEYFDVLDGEQGEQGPAGEDGAPGVGVPSGGSQGYVLKKKSNADYDTEWAEGGGGSEHGIPSGGNSNQVLAKNSNTDYDVHWVDPESYSQEQADWDQTDSSEVDYIKNKPENLVQDANYVHTDYNYDGTAKSIVDGVTAALAGKVDKNGTDSLMTADEHTKLAGIAAGAQVNVLEGVQVNGTDLPIVDKKVNVVISGKADKVSNATNGNFAVLDSTGNLVDSQKNPSSYYLKTEAYSKVEVDALIPDELNDLNDVTISGTPSNGDVLTYDSTSSTFKPQAPSSGTVNDAYKTIISAGTTFTASGEDTFKINAGSNVTITPLSGNDKGIQISSTGGGQSTGDMLMADYDSSGDVKTAGGIDAYVAAAIPTVNNATLTIQKNGTNVQTFTANASSDVTANITVPTAVSELTNDSGYITASAISGKADSSAAYLIGDTAETTLDDADYVPFYDTSATAKRKTLWSNIKSVLKTYFDTVYATISSVSAKANKVSSATNGHLAGLDSNGDLTDSGVVASKVIEKVATATGLLRDDGTVDTTSYVSDVSGKADKVSSATSGNFAGLDSNGNLTDSGSKASDFLTSHQDISGKADKVSGATSGNFAGLDSNGNLTDSGSKASDFLTSHQDISGKADKVASATNGHLAGLDGNGNLTDSGVTANKVIEKATTATGLLKDDGTVDTNTYVADTPTFSEASTRANLAGTGETFSTILGKIKKYFTDLKALAFIDTTTDSPTTKYLRGDGTWQPVSGGGHTMLPNNTVISGITTASADNTDNNVVSAYGIGNWSNVITSRYIYEDISSGDNCIGTWYSGDLSNITSADEADWWQNDGFKNLLSDDNFEIKIKFDPFAADEEVLICTGYILDDTTGKICIRFGSAVTKSTHRVAVDITRTRTNVSIES